MEPHSFILKLPCPVRVTARTGLSFHTLQSIGLDFKEHMNSAIKTWPISTAAGAAGMQARATRQWFSTGVLKLTGIDRPSTGTGDHCGLSLRRILQVGITRKLNKLGVSVSAAAHAAAVFTDEGQTGRHPGELFPCGKTYLLTGPSGTLVRNGFHDTPIADLSNDGACIVLEVNRVVDHVNSVLKDI